MTTWIKFDEFSENFQTASDPSHSIFGKNVALFREAQKFATKFIWIGVNPPFSPKKLPKKRNKIFWIGNDPPPSLRKFSENSSILVHAITPYLPIFLTWSHEVT